MKESDNNSQNPPPRRATEINMKQPAQEYNTATKIVVIEYGTVFVPLLYQRFVHWLSATRNV